MFAFIIRCKRNLRVPGACSTFFCCPDIDQIEATKLPLGSFNIFRLRIFRLVLKNIFEFENMGPESLIFLLKWRVMLLNLTHLQVIMNFKWGKGRKTTFGFNKTAMTHTFLGIRRHLRTSNISSI